MAEYHASFSKITVGTTNADITARVSDPQPAFIETVEAIRSRILEQGNAAGVNWARIPNGNFMEVEFLIEPHATDGVAFVTPYLPKNLVEILQSVLSDTGIKNVF